jgi:hypothetical protein
MTDEKPDKKLDLILARLSDLETRIAALEAQKGKCPRHNPHSNEWIDHKVAAEMMRRPASYFHKRNGLGEYEYWPQIERWQPGGKRTRLYVRREHVEAWVEASRTPPTSRITMPRTGIGYESAVPTLLRLRAYGTMKSLGLEQYIPAAEIKKVAKKGTKKSTKKGA